MLSLLVSCLLVPPPYFQHCLGDLPLFLIGSLRSLTALLSLALSQRVLGSAGSTFFVLRSNSPIPLLFSPFWLPRVVGRSFCNFSDRTSHLLFLVPTLRMDLFKPMYFLLNNPALAIEHKVRYGFILVFKKWRNLGFKIFLWSLFLRLSPPPSW